MQRFYRALVAAKKILTLTDMMLLISPSGVLAQERAGDAALGALSGVVVLGPVGAIAGAVIGYTAGPSISHSWRTTRSGPRLPERSAQRSTTATSDKGAAASRSELHDVARQSASTPRPVINASTTQTAADAISAPPKSVSGKWDAPPIQGLE